MWCKLCCQLSSIVGLVFVVEVLKEKSRAPVFIIVLVPVVGAGEKKNRRA